MNNSVKYVTFLKNIIEICKIWNLLLKMVNYSCYKTRNGKRTAQAALKNCS